MFHVSRGVVDLATEEVEATTVHLGVTLLPLAEKAETLAANDALAEAAELAGELAPLAPVQPAQADAAPLSFGKHEVRARDSRGCGDSVVGRLSEENKFLTKMAWRHCACCAAGTDH